MIRKEPSLIVGAASAALAVLVLYNVLDERQAQAWGTLLVALLPILQALVTRQLVFSPHTIEQAGLDPRSVEERADDPMAPPFRPKG